MSTKIAVTVSTIFILLVGYIYTTQEEIYLSVRNQSTQVAQVSWIKEFPYIGVTSYLLVKDENWKVKCRYLLLQNRDDYTDIFAEILAIEWKDEDTIQLQLNRNHYMGKDIISIKNDMVCI